MADAPNEDQIRENMREALMQMLQNDEEEFCELVKTVIGDKQTETQAED